MVHLCINCNKKLKNNQRKFCGNSCKCKFFYKKNPGKCNKWNKENPRPPVKNKCIACGSPCGRNKYCSDECKPRRITIPSEKPYWSGMARINAKCFCCNNTFGVLHIHHRDGIHDNNNNINLIPLCPSCHSSVHHKPANKRYISKDITKLIILSKLREELNNTENY